jgi:hypothetical protein
MVSQELSGFEDGFQGNLAGEEWFTREEKSDP